MADMKMVDGEIVPLTKAEQVDHDARIAAWQADAGNRAIKAQIAALPVSSPVNSGSSF